MEANKKLATLGDDIAEEMIAITKAVCDANSEQNYDDSKDEFFSIIRTRAMEPPVIVSLSSVLTSPIEDGDFTSLKMHQLVFYSIISKLSLEQLQPYRSAIKTLMGFDISSFNSRSSHYAQTMHLINNARLLDRFIENPEDIWVPENKFDCISYRTLWERVHTAEQMRPYMHAGALPEVSTVVAAEVMGMAVNDVEHQHFLIDFVSECVPVGKAWYPMRDPVKQMVRVLEGKNKEQLVEAGDEDYLEEAKNWLEVLKKWESNI
ncbi:hypothetical protein FCULG_00006473 [Fusarium culmorum]|uniref:DUF5071 domain-containing protein n=1 Tax=Fusarium culmorum TaxID=5516 RepID=A0A2T4GVB1_FUSCU|nr:hypothetical protein FCULG_00006473 [Fusarium culmorum]